MSRTLASTPKADGFRMPAEWEAHAGCWMLFPERTDTWRNGAKPAQSAFAQVATAIAEFEPVTVCVSTNQYQNARVLLPPHIRVVEMSSNDAWIRDCGPTFVKHDSGEIRGVDWEFNAWGGLEKGLYFPWDKDQLVAQKVLEIERKDRYKCNIVNEGGGIHVDGEGTVMAVKPTIANPNRNPNLSLSEIEQNLMDYLNVEKVIWFERGVYEDETDGHIDNLCCFVRPGVVALTWTNDKSDPQYDISAEAYDILNSTTNAKGRSIEIHKIHQPNILYVTEEEASTIDRSETAIPRQAGDRLAASYVNFYIANGGIVMPIFNDVEYDQKAIETLQNLFPKRKISPVYSREILLGGGNIHCITQQQPL